MATTVKDDLGDPLFLRALRNKLANNLGGSYRAMTALKGLRHGLFLRGNGNQRMTDGVVDHLNVDVFQATETDSLGLSAVPETLLRRRLCRRRRISFLLLVLIISAHLVLLRSGLAGLAQDMFAEIVNALALVRFGRAVSANDRSDLANNLFVNALDENLGCAFHGKANPFGRNHFNRMGKSKAQSEILPFIAAR